MAKGRIIQARNPKTRKYVKINTGTRRIIGQKRTPYKGVPKK